MAIRTTKPVLVMAALLLLPLAVSVEIACCVGMASMGSMDMNDPGRGDGMSCCDEAHDDALARHCCEGGERLDSRHPTARVAASPPTVLPALPAISEQPAAGVPRLRQATAKPPDLFTLHSALLI